MANLIPYVIVRLSRLLFCWLVVSVLLAFGEPRVAAAGGGSVTGAPTGSASPGGSQSPSSGQQGGGSATAEQEVMMYQAIGAAADDVAKRLQRRYCPGSNITSVSSLVFYDPRTASDITAAQTLKAPLDQLLLQVAQPLSARLQGTFGPVVLSWTGLTGQSFEVYRGDTSGGEQPLSGHGVVIGSDSAIDPVIEPGHTYYYEITEDVPKGHKESMSNEVRVSIPLMFNPANVKATSSSVALEWTSVPDSAGYILYRGDSPSALKFLCHVTQPDAGITVSYTDTDNVKSLTAGQTYYYQYASLPSMVRSSVIHVTIPVPLTAVISNATSVALTWPTVLDATRYILFRGDSASEFHVKYDVAQPGAKTVSFKDTGLKAGQTYYYQYAALPSKLRSLEIQVTLAAPMSPRAAAPLRGKGSNMNKIVEFAAGGAGGGAPASPTVGANTFLGIASGVLSALSGASSLFTSTTSVSGGAGTTDADAFIESRIIDDFAKGSAEAEVFWPAVPTATSYCVYRGTASCAESSSPVATGLTATIFTDTGLTNGTTYYYKVAAVNSGGTSPLSPEFSTMAGVRFYAPAIYPIVPDIDTDMSARLTPELKLNDIDPFDPYDVDPLSEFYLVQGLAAKAAAADQQDLLSAYQSLAANTLILPSDSKPTESTETTKASKTALGGDEQVDADAPGTSPAANTDAIDVEFAQLAKDVATAVAWSPFSPSGAGGGGSSQSQNQTQGQGQGSGGQQGQGGGSASGNLLPLAAVKADVATLTLIDNASDPQQRDALMEFETAISNNALDSHIEAVQALSAVSTALATAIQPYGTVSSADPVAQTPETVANMITRGWQLEQLIRDPGTRIVRVRLEMSQGSMKSTSFLWKFWWDSSAMAQLSYAVIGTDGGFEDAGTSLAYHSFENGDHFFDQRGPSDSSSHRSRHGLW